MNARRRPDQRGSRRASAHRSGYVRATFLVALVDAVGIGTGLAIMGVPLALPLASLVFSVADDDSAARLSREVDRVLEEHAPGFTELVVAKSMHRASDWKPGMPAYRRGQRWQVTALPAVDLRPAPGLGRAETPIEQLYLGSAGPLPEAACTACAAATPRWPVTVVRDWPRCRLNRAVLALATR